MSKEGTLHLVYYREYEDPDERGYDAYFNIYHTIFRNLPLSQLNRLNNKDFQKKVKEFCDKNYKETASNFTGDSGVEMIHGSEYYKTYEDVYGPSGMPDDKTFFEDYGQKWDTRQFFKHDFNKEVTKFMGGII
tara:strand:+ start:715 stop:1113 length:399 start_codon:yes stop_codon:yes gene_type:complete